MTNCNDPKSKYWSLFLLRHNVTDTSLRIFFKGVVALMLLIMSEVVKKSYIYGETHIIGDISKTALS